MASSMHAVRPRDLLAVGFFMEPVERLPLSWPLALRRPAGRRRIGPAYVMDACVQAQLSPLGPIKEGPQFRTSAELNMGPVVADVGFSENL